MMRNGLLYMLGGFETNGTLIDRVLLVVSNPPNV